MPKFSKYYRINAPQSQLDFVDINTDYDTKVYVDPYAIELRDDVWSGECSELIRVFFLEILNALRRGDESLALNLMSHLHEPAETFLGVSRGKPNGKGVGEKQAKQLIYRIKASKAFRTGVLSDLSEMALFVDRVGRDKISDLTTNIIRHKLVEYTGQQCRLYDVDLEEYNGPPPWDGVRKRWHSKTVRLPRINDIPVLLIPKFIVRRELSLNSQEFYNKQITDFYLAEHYRATSSLAYTLQADPRPVTKAEIREKHPKSKEMIAEVVANNPHLLEIYKDLAKLDGKTLINVSDEDVSVAQACLDLEKALKSTGSGPGDAENFHILAMHILTVCFFPKLVLPRKEWEINDGRKRLDIVYTNAADDGFFSHRRDAHNTRAAMVIVECKNYTKDIANPEIDQLLGRFDDNRGYLGILVCRSIDNRKKVLDKCRDLAVARKAYIMVLDDQDMLNLLDARKLEDVGRLENILHAKFRDLIS